MWLPVDKHRTLTGATLIQESPMGSDLLRSEILGILELMHPRILDEGFAYDSFWPVRRFLRMRCSIGADSRAL